MRVPDFSRYRKGMQAAAFLLCGMILGAAVHQGMVLDQTHRIVADNFELKEQLHLTEQQLQATRKETSIRSIVVYIEERPDDPPLDRAAEAELKKRLSGKNGDLNVFLGRKIYDIGSEAQMARALLEGKRYTDVGGKNYAVSIRTMLVADGVLTVWIEARPTLK
ncbi:hypothetical protein [Cohnella massiliensis]|uniref:hypothetical protein n=1 Tax=Cohnella massiliensis TaxID=1816691 RepID=UPI0009BC6E79|nr:hypothetical protein [Cohnella massiliensis]